MPKPNSCQSFSICQWNQNMISAHKYLKLSLWRAYITVYNFDVICLSKTYLDSSILHDEDNLQISGDNLHKEDHPLNIEWGDMFVFTTKFHFH